MLGVRCTGSSSHNIGLDDPWVHRSKTTQNSVKRHFGLKIFFACGALKGLRLRDCGTQPRIGYPNRHHHPRHPRQLVGTPGPGGPDRLGRRAQGVVARRRLSYARVLPSVVHQNFTQDRYDRPRHSSTRGSVAGGGVHTFGQTNPASPLCPWLPFHG